MRGVERNEQSMFSYVSLEDRVPKDHPLRFIRAIVDAALVRMSSKFEALYQDRGRESIPPEQLLRALLLQILYTIRSERQLVEQLDYNLLFRWFVGLGVDDAVWNHSSFSKNRDRLAGGDIADVFIEEVLGEAKERDFLSSEHFTVDGTLVQAWAGQKSFKKDPIKTGNDNDNPPPDPKGHSEKNPEVNFHGEQRSNTTHSSTTDPEARLAKKSEGSEAKLSYCGNLVTENRNGLVMVAELTTAHGTAERDMVSIMVEQIPSAKRRALRFQGSEGISQSHKGCRVVRHDAAHPGEPQSPRHRGIVLHPEMHGDRRAGGGAHNGLFRQVNPEVTAWQKNGVEIELARRKSKHGPNEHGDQLIARGAGNHSVRTQHGHGAPVEGRQDNTIRGVLLAHNLEHTLLGRLGFHLHHERSAGKGAQHLAQGGDCYSMPAVRI
jgi:transposase